MSNDPTTTNETKAKLKELGMANFGTSSYRWEGYSKAFSFKRGLTSILCLGAAVLAYSSEMFWLFPVFALIGYIFGMMSVFHEFQSWYTKILIVLAKKFQWAADQERVVATQKINSALQLWTENMHLFSQEELVNYMSYSSFWLKPKILDYLQKKDLDKNNVLLESLSTTLAPHISLDSKPSKKKAVFVKVDTPNEQRDVNADIPSSTHTKL